MNNTNLGKAVFDRTYDPSFIDGWGVRPYSWSLGVSVQQELMPRVSVNVGYFRNWWGNQYTVDNRTNALSDWTPFGIQAPVDSRLPGGGGQVISGLYDLVPTAVGKVDEWATNAKNYAKQTENWHGVDVGVVARLRSGLTVQGGTSTGRKLSDSCALRAALPEQGQGTRGATNSITSASGSPVNPYCREVEPYQTSIRGLATYTIPRIDLQVSGTWCATTRAARWQRTVDKAICVHRERPAAARAELCGSHQRDGQPHRTEHVLFLAPQQHRPAHCEDHPVRPTRTQVGMDIYNLTNTDVVTGFNQTFSPTSTTWLTPTSIQPARYAKISAQFDF